MKTETREHKISLIDLMNSRHAAILVGGKFAILSEDTDPITGYPCIRLSSVADMKRVYANQKIPYMSPDGTVKHRNPVDIWMETRERRSLKGIVFNPGKVETNGYYNLFNGFAVEAKPGRCDLYLDHVRENICDGNLDHYEWLFDWMGDAIQNPAHRKGTAVVLRGGQGTGKGVFATCFGKLFGPHFVHISGQHRLTGKFNNHLKGQLLVFVDEGYWAGDRRDVGTLKALITEKKMLVEPKFQDAFMIENHMRVIMASNNEWVVPADLDERRFFVLDVGARNQKDGAYFGALMAQMENGGYGALMHELVSREIESDLRQIPRTGALFDQIVRTMPPVTAWWFECLFNGSVYGTGVGWPEKMAKDAVYDAFREFCERQKKRHVVDVASFWRELRRVCPGIIPNYRPRGDGPRIRQALFPELGACRTTFNNIVNIPVGWDADEPGEK